MVTKLFLRPHSLPLFTLHSKILFPKIPSLPKRFLILSPLSSSSTSLHLHPKPQISDPNHSYGPSLHKGTKPPIPISHSPLNKGQQQQQAIEEENEENLIDEESFSRVFNIAALRVPAKDCFALESRLRGHLLNWPRGRNIG
ncbi:hypothetical protein M0R45_015034 [Rubus argutus]|uniref:Uncharacterized protein n=1 Tax=Rubus argutus TaxID=59490 RepID=A0AAW1XPJ8_RUBAR